MSAQKKGAAGGAAAPFQTSIPNWKDSKATVPAQRGINVPFDKVAAAVHAQQAGKQFAGDLLTQLCAPDALFIQVCEFFSDQEFLKNFLRAVQKNLERGAS